MNFTFFLTLINKLFVEIKWLKEFTRCRNIKKKKNYDLIVYLEEFIQSWLK